MGREIETTQNGIMKAELVPQSSARCSLARNGEWLRFCAA
jgi:hypothetical protein